MSIVQRDHAASFAGSGALDPATAALGELVSVAEAMAPSGRSDFALHAYEEWIRHHPADPLLHAAHYNHGVLLSAAGHTPRAAVAFAESARIAPTFLPAFINAGLAFERLGRLDLAAAQWLRVAEQGKLGDDSAAHAVTALKHLSRVFKLAGDVASAEEALRRSLAIDPRQRDALQHMTALRQMQCKWPVLPPTDYRGEREKLVAALSPLAAAIETDDPVLQLALAARHFDVDLMRSTPPWTVGRWLPPEVDPVGARPLRIGYVSPDLREHAVGFLAAELFELHDREQVEVSAYYSGRIAPDALQARIRHSVDHWTDIAAWPDKKAAKQIVQDEIDILIDLGGYTAGAPTSLFALRPAPVIVNWLGFPGTMATPHHQYIIADPEIIPPGCEKYYTERVLRLPCYQPTDRKRAVSECTPSRADVGLPHDAVVYCCFNGTQKITPFVFQLWMDILSRVPGSVLWLLSCDAATDARLRAAAVGHGISPDRLVFAPRLLNADHLARYRLADLFLDTFPYGAHTTASDALWMGVPVLTIEGRGFASRVCSSLVRAAGIGELTCADPMAYVERAAELGTVPEKIAAFRRRLESGRDRCTLFDMPLLVRRLEELFRQMMTEYVRGQAPEPDLTNLGVYGEIGEELVDEVGRIFGLEEYEERYSRALAYRHGISPVPFDVRLWPSPHSVA